jgi:hypothetical protein
MIFEDYKGWKKFFIYYTIFVLDCLFTRWLFQNDYFEVAFAWFRYHWYFVIFSFTLLVVRLLWYIFIPSLFHLDYYFVFLFFIIIWVYINRNDVGYFLFVRYFFRLFTKNKKCWFFWFRIAEGGLYFYSSILMWFITDVMAILIFLLWVFKKNKIQTFEESFLKTYNTWKENYICIKEFFKKYFFKK